MSTTFHCLGVDLGLVNDYTAATLVEWEGGAPEPEYRVPLLRRWPLGTNYLTIAADLVKLVKTIPEVVLCLDATGCGLPVYGMVCKELKDAGVVAGTVAVAITAGSDTNQGGEGYWKVPKKTLISCVQVCLNQKRLHVADVHERETLLRELGTFKTKINIATGAETFESWRERDHDDMVLSCSLGLWGAMLLNVPKFVDKIRRENAARRAPRRVTTYDRY